MKNSRGANERGTIIRGVYMATCVMFPVTIKTLAPAEAVTIARLYGRTARALGHNGSGSRTGTSKMTRYPLGHW
jgi:hypothetical protein